MQDEDYDIEAAEAAMGPAWCTAAAGVCDAFFGSLHAGAQLGTPDRPSTSSSIGGGQRADAEYTVATAHTSVSWSTPVAAGRRSCVAAQCDRTPFSTPGSFVQCALDSTDAPGWTSIFEGVEADLFGLCGDASSPEQSECDDVSDADTQHMHAAALFDVVHTHVNE